MSRLKHPNISPFYEWLDHDEIRELVHRTLNIPPGERLVLLKALVPGLVEAVGVDELEEFLDELAMKARRYDEARSHPGEGRQERRTPGEPIGGVTPGGHVHLAEARNPDRPGGRYAERELERELWREARLGRGKVQRIAVPALIGVAAVAFLSAVALRRSGARGERHARGVRGRRQPRARTKGMERDTQLANRNDRYAG